MRLLSLQKPPPPVSLCSVQLSVYPLTPNPQWLILATEWSSTRDSGIWEVHSHTLTQHSALCLPRSPQVCKGPVPVIAYDAFPSSCLGTRRFLSMRRIMYNFSSATKPDLRDYLISLTDSVDDLPKDKNLFITDTLLRTLTHRSRCFLNVAP